MEKYHQHVADFLLFVEVARTQSYQRAAARLNMPVATLSRRITALEKSLGVTLLIRTTRSVKLASSAKHFYEQCLRLLDAATAAHAALATDDVMDERVQISMPVDLGVELLGPMIGEYALQHPGLRVQFDLSSSARDLFHDQLDLVFRIGRTLDDRVVARKIGTIRAGLFASPAFLKTHFFISRPADLEKVPCLDMEGAQGAMPWIVSGRRWEKAPGEAAFSANNVGLLRSLSELGLGVALLPFHATLKSVQSGKLMPVLANESVPGWPVYAISATRNLTPRVRGLLLHVKEQFREGHI